jgi:DNA-binding LytR/AlgR family response regulator
MPKINGIDFLKSLKLNANIIITTAYPVYAVEAYGLDVLDYLVKPISFERFLKACNKVMELSAQKKITPDQTAGASNYFFIKCENQIEKVFYDDLLYAEAMMNYVMLYTNVKKMMVYITIKGLEEQLPSEIFMKVHKSFIVNSKKINNIEGNIIRIGKAEIPIRQNSQDDVMKMILKDRMLKR